MEGKVKGIVIATRARLFEVRLETGKRLKCEVRQKVKSEAKATTPVAVGDDVLVGNADEERGVIEEVLERKTFFGRPAKGEDKIFQVIAANLDQLAMVVSINSPVLKPGLIDRFIIAAMNGNMTPILIINKVDLESDSLLDEVAETYRNLGYKVFLTSAETETGLDELSEVLVGHRTIFAGHSGVGKSSILNKLIPGLNLKTKLISEASNKGKHTTTSIELYELPTGGYLIDSPGLKVMGLWEVDKKILPEYYIEFANYIDQCRFTPCSHSHEPGCAVKAAVETGEVSRIRHENYLAIAETLP